MHLSSQETRAIAEFKKRVGQLPGITPVQFILFGSRARGQGNENSDLDILVLLNERTRPTRDRIIDIASDLFLEYEVALSPLVLSQSQFSMLNERERLLGKEISRDGIPL